MSTQTLKLFYKGSKLSTVHSGSAHYSVVSANNQNLCETNSQSTQTQLLATDTQASTVTAHAGSQTDIAYSPYGDDSLPAAHRILSRFTGQTCLPSAIGYLLGNGHRLFSPGLMRFHSADSLSPFGKGGLNAYAYCGNDPINRADPSGRSFIKRLTRKYSYDVLAPRLKYADPSFSANEYKALGKSLEKRNKRSLNKLHNNIDRSTAHGRSVIKNLNTHNNEYVDYLELTSNPSTGRYTYSKNITQSLLGDIPIWTGAISRDVKALLAPPEPHSIVNQIPEELLLEDMQERLRRLRED
jgi:RHS repeat-associated protein